MSLLYVETNLIVAAATGRDPRAVALISGSVAGLTLLIPGVCFQEALRWFKDESRRRGDFSRSLVEQAGELRRDVTGETRSIVSHLEERRVENDGLLRRIEERLYSAIAELSSLAEILPVTAALLEASRKATLIAGPTDNLIVHTVLDHARATSEVDKALFTENRNDFGRPKVRAALAAAGVKYFARSDHAVGWAESRQGRPG